MKINIDFVKKIGKDKLILMIIAGVVLVLCTVWDKGSGDKSSGESASVYYTASDNSSYTERYVREQEKRLKEILGKIEGVGNVHVMITVKNSSEKNVLTEGSKSYEDTSEADGEGGSRKIYTYSEDKKTIYVTDSAGRSEPYVISENSPEVEGVAVVADGAGNIIIKEKIINVIKALFDIDLNKISVE